MQITKISAYSLKSVLKSNAKGNKTVGYTVKPGFSNGLNMTSLHAHGFGKYIGF